MHTNRYLTYLARINKLLIITVLLLIPFIYSCIKSLNPYTISEAGIIVADSSLIYNGVTFLVGSKLSLTLQIELKEFIEKITVNSPGNDTNICIDTSVGMNDFWGSILTFYFRYYTSGQKQITIVTHFEDGRLSVTSLSLTIVAYTDTIPPLVRIVSKPEYTISSNSDTVISEVDSLWLKVWIIDVNSRLNFNTLTINNDIFDSVQISDTNSVNAYKHFDLQDITNYLPIEISAKDIHGNQGTEAYWIRRKQ